MYLKIGFLDLNIIFILFIVFVFEPMLSVLQTRA